MKSPLISALLLLLASVGAVVTQTGCSRHATESAAAAETHPLKGVVTAVSPAKNTIRVKHEEIPGFMRAMTMQFTVAAEDCARLKVGDTITAVLGSQGDDWILTDIKVVAAAGP